MCRLYGFRANEPTKVECTLVHAQNALMVQSREDLGGYSHGHGWGLATYEDGLPAVERMNWAAYHGEHFRAAAGRIYSKLVLAHVRRATVGPATLANTHPFVHGRWALAHNGTVPAFDRVRQKLLNAMDACHRAALAGDTDSEHVFRLIMSLNEEWPDRPLHDSLRRAVRSIVDWCREIDPNARIGLNLLLADGDRIVGCRWGRSLYYVERVGVYDCEICGFPHIHHLPGRDYRAAVVASEPITHESWREVPEGSVFTISPDVRMTIEPL